MTEGLTGWVARGAAAAARRADGGRRSRSSGSGRKLPVRTFLDDRGRDGDGDVGGVRGQRRARAAAGGRPARDVPRGRAAAADLPGRPDRHAPDAAVAAGAGCAGSRLRRGRGVDVRVMPARERRRGACGARAVRRDSAAAARRRPPRRCRRRRSASGARLAVRVGVDVGGTFTKAVACDPASGEVVARAVVSTTHASRARRRGGGARRDRAGRGRRARRRARARSSSSRIRPRRPSTRCWRATPPASECSASARRPHLRRARKRTSVGEIRLAPGRTAGDRARVPRRYGGRQPRGHEGCARAARGAGRRGDLRLGGLRRRGRRRRARRARPRRAHGPARVRRPRAHRPLRPRAAHGHRRGQRRHPAGRAARRRGGGAGRCGARPTERRCS